MANTREIAKKKRIEKIKEIVRLAREGKGEIDKARLMAKIMVEDGVSKKTALEEIEAVLLYDPK